MEVTETKSGSFIVHGRSDSTLNRFGVRIGTSEIYSTLENLDYINDSLVIHLDSEIKTSYYCLFKQDLK